MISLPIDHGLPNAIHVVSVVISWVTWVADALEVKMYRKKISMGMKNRRKDDHFMLFI